MYLETFPLYRRTRIEGRVGEERSGASRQAAHEGTRHKKTGATRKQAAQEGRLARKQAARALEWNAHVRLTKENKSIHGAGVI